MHDTVLIYLIIVDVMTRTVTDEGSASYIICSVLVCVHSHLHLLSSAFLFQIRSICYVLPSYIPSFTHIQNNSYS